MSTVYYCWLCEAPCPGDQAEQDDASATVHHFCSEQHRLDYLELYFL